MIPFVYGMEECQRVQDVNDIPCSLISSWKPSTGCNITIDVYGEDGTLVQNINWTDSQPYCNASFNISTIGTYTYNSSIEDGVVNVEADNLMLSLTIGLGIIAGFLFWFAFKLEEEHFLMKLLSIFTGMSVIVLIPVTYIINDTSQAFYRLILFFFVSFWLYVGGYFVYWIFNRFRRIVDERE